MDPCWKSDDACPHSPYHWPSPKDEAFQQCTFILLAPLEWRWPLLERICGGEYMQAWIMDEHQHSVHFSVLWACWGFGCEHQQSTIFPYYLINHTIQPSSGNKSVHVIGSYIPNQSVVLHWIIVCIILLHLWVPYILFQTASDIQPPAIWNSVINDGVAYILNHGIPWVPNILWLIANNDAIPIHKLLKSSQMKFVTIITTETLLSNCVKIYALCHSRIISHIMNTFNASLS